MSTQEERVELSRAKIALDRDSVQKKTFTKWINSHLKQGGETVDDLFVDLRDGRRLLLLLELLTGEKLRREKGTLQFHKLQDINTVLRCMEKRKIDTVNISNTAILEGSSKLTLGLVWRLILHFQISQHTAASSETENVDISEVKKVILQWCQDVTEGYAGVNITNFSTSWKDGLAFNAIINRFRPHLVDFDSLSSKNPLENLRNAFSIAEESLGVLSLLEAEDLNMAVPDENSILTYISFLIKAFPEEIPPHPKDMLAIQRWSAYEVLAQDLNRRIKDETLALCKQPLPSDAKSVKIEGEKLSHFKENVLADMEADKQLAEQQFAAFQLANTTAFHPLVIQPELHIFTIQQAWDKLIQTVQDRESGNVTSAANLMASKQRTEISELTSLVKTKMAFLQCQPLAQNQEDLEKSAAEQLRTHQEILDLQERIRRCHADVEGSVHVNMPDAELLELDSLYQQLKDLSTKHRSMVAGRLQLLAECEDLLKWIKEKEQVELMRDLASTDTASMAASSSQLKEDISKKKGTIHELLKEGELIAASQPEARLIKGKLQEVDGQWQELMKVHSCIELNRDRVQAYCKFVTKSKECENRLDKLQQQLNTKPGIAKELLDVQEQGTLLSTAEEEMKKISLLVNELIQQAPVVPPLQKRRQPIPRRCFVKTLCAITSGSVCLEEGDECLLIDTNDTSYWKVATTSGSCLLLPSPLLALPLPCEEFVQLIDRLRKALSELQKIQSDRVAKLKRTREAFDILQDVQAIETVNLNESFQAKRRERQQLVDLLRQAQENFFAKYPEEKGPDSFQVQLKVDSALRHWDVVCKEYSEQLTTPVSQFSDWLSSAEQDMLAECALLAQSPTVMKKQQEPLKKLFLEIEERQKEFTSLVGLLRKLGGEDTAAEVNHLSTRWTAIKMECGKRQHSISQACSALEEYEQTKASFDGLLLKAEEELVPLWYAHHTPAVLQEQLKKCEDLLSRVRSMQPHLSSITENEQQALRVAETWEGCLQGFKEEQPTVQGQKATTNRTEKHSECAKAKDSLPREVEEASWRLKNLLTKLEEREQRLQQRLVKAGSAHDLLEKVVDWLEEARKVSIEEAESNVVADPADIDSHLDQLDSLESGIEGHSALLAQAIAAYGELMADRDESERSASDEADKVPAIHQLNEQLLALKQKTKERKQQLKELKEQTESFNRLCTEQLFWLAGVEDVLQKQEVPSFEEETLSKQLTQHKAFHASIVDHQAAVDRVKAVGEALLSNMVASEEGKEQQRQQLTGLLSSFGHLLLSSAAREKQLESVSDRLSSFKKLWAPFSEWLSQLELKLITDGPPAVDLSTANKQFDLVELHHKCLQEKNSELSDILAAAQQLLLTRHMTANTRVTVTHTLLAKNVFTGNVTGKSKLEQTSEKEVPYLASPANVQATKKDDKGNEPDAVGRVDIRAEAEHALAEDLANWVQREYVHLPQRFKQVLQSCLGRTKNLTTMQARITTFQPLLVSMQQWMEKFKSSVKLLPDAADDVSLEEQVVHVKALLNQLDEKEEQMKTVTSSAQKLLRFHDEALELLQQDLAQVAARRGLSVQQLHAEPLNAPTAQGVDALQKDILELERIWDTLHKQLSSRLSEIEVSLVASRDLNQAVAEQRQSILEFLAEVSGLKAVSADLIKLKKQKEEQKEFNREAASLQSQMSALKEGRAKKVDILTSLSDIEKPLAEAIGLLDDRNAALCSAEDVLSSMEKLEPWLNQKEVYLDALHSTKEDNDQLEVFASELLGKKEEFSKLMSESLSLSAKHGATIAHQEFCLLTEAACRRLADLEDKVVKCFRNQTGSISNSVKGYEEAVKGLSQPLLLSTSAATNKKSLIELSANVQNASVDVDDILERMSRLQKLGFKPNDLYHAVTEGEVLKDATGNLLVEVSKCETNINTALEMAEQFEKEKVRLQLWLAEKEKELRHLDNIGDNSTVLEQQLEKLQIVNTAVSEHQPTVTAFACTGKDLIQFGEKFVTTGSTHPDTDEILSNVKKVTSDFDELVHDGSTQTEEVTAQLKRTRQFDKELAELMDWLTEMEASLSPLDDRHETLDSTVIEKFVDQLEAVSDGLTAREPIKANIWKASVQIAESKRRSRRQSDQGLGVGEKASSMEQKWRELLAAVALQKKNVAEMLQKTITANENLDDIEARLRRGENEVSTLGVAQLLPQLVDKQIMALKTAQVDVTTCQTALRKLSSSSQKESSTSSAVGERVYSLHQRCSALQDTLNASMDDLIKWKSISNDFFSSASTLSPQLQQLVDKAKKSTSHLPSANLNVLKSQMESNEGVDGEYKSLQAGVHRAVTEGSSLLKRGQAQQLEGVSAVSCEIENLQGKSHQIEKLTGICRGQIQVCMKSAQLFKTCHDSLRHSLSRVEDSLADMEMSKASKTPEKDGSTDQLLALTHQLANLETALEELKRNSTHLKTVCTSSDHAAIDQQVENVLSQWTKLQHDVMVRLGTKQSAAKHALDFQEKLEPFLTWLDEFQREETAPIGVKHADIEHLLHDMQALSDTLIMQKPELDNLWRAAQRLMDEPTADKARIQQQMDEIQMMFDHINRSNTNRSRKVEEAMHEATQFEHPFEDLTNERESVELIVLKPERVTGSLEDSQQQLATMEDVHEKILAHQPHVDEVHVAGLNLEQLCELNSSAKENFRTAVEDFHARWGVVQLRAGLRVEKLRAAVSETDNFITGHLNPLLNWMNEADEILSPDRPVGGDIRTVEEISQEVQHIGEELVRRERQVAQTNQIGQHLIDNVLDDPFITEEQLCEVNMLHETLKKNLTVKHSQLAAARQNAAEFDERYIEATAWLNGAIHRAVAMHQAASSQTCGQLDKVERVQLQQQEFEEKTAVQLEEVEAVCRLGERLIENSPPGSESMLQASLTEIRSQRDELCKVMQNWAVEVQASLLSLRGLKDAVGDLKEMVEKTDKELRKMEKGAAVTTVKDAQAELDLVTHLLDDMTEHQPQMDILSKALRERQSSEKNATDKDPQMKAIAELQHRWQNIWLRATKQQGVLEDKLQQLTEEEAVKNFNLDKWREKFVGWMDDNKVRVIDLFYHFDLDKNQQLSMEEFKSGMSTPGLPITPVEISLVAEAFDEDRDGAIDYWEFATGLRPERHVQFRHKPRNEAEQVDQEIRKALSYCTCSKQFQVRQVGDGRYTFGDSEMMRMVRILRTHVMVRVGGGWQELHDFLSKHDPCRTADHTNVYRALQKHVPGLHKQDAMAKFMSKTQTAVKAHRHQAFASPATPGREGRYSIKPIQFAPESGRDQRGTCQVHQRTTTPSNEYSRRIQQPSTGASHIPRSTTPTREYGRRVRHPSSGTTSYIPRSTTPTSEFGRQLRSTTPTNEYGRQVKQPSSGTGTQFPRSTTPTNETGRRVRHASGSSQIPRSTTPTSELGRRVRLPSGSGAGRSTTPTKELGYRVNQSGAGHTHRNTTPTGDTGRRIRPASVGPREQMIQSPTREAAHPFTTSVERPRMVQRKSSFSKLPIFSRTSKDTSHH